MRLGSRIRLGARANGSGPEGGTSENPDDWLTDGGAGLSRQNLVLDWASEDGTPWELELSILPRFMDLALPNAERPWSMLPFRWGTSISLGGQTDDAGGSLTPMSCIPARGIRTRLCASSIRVALGYLRQFDPVVPGWVDFQVTLCPIVGSGSTQVDRFVQLPLDQYQFWGAAGPPEEWMKPEFVLPHYASEWRMRIVNPNEDDIDRTQYEFELWTPDPGWRIRRASADELADWAPLELDAYSVRYGQFPSEHNFEDATVEVEFR